MGTIAVISLVVMVVAILLNGVRLLRGPTDFDRLLAAETLALGLIGLLLLQASHLDYRYYVDAALGLALFSFVGTVVFARSLDRGGDDD